VAGVHAVRELLKVRARAVGEFWLRDGFDAHADLRELAELAERSRVRVTTVSTATLDRVVPVHQGVVAFALEDPELNFGDLKQLERSTLLVLDEVEDPHNLGAVLRTAWLFGVDGILTPENRAAPVSATVSKIARGAAEHVPVMRDTGLAESLKHLKEQGYWVYGLAAGGDKTLYDVEIPEKVIWVLGSESSGIRKPIERVCDELIAIPQADPDASFNVSVAAALAVGETYRQRQGTPDPD
jgi:23S rRNA (guanosine2251-2'-O)-methyltransferase